MVGLKTFWILISALFLLAACVPQTKQTECRSNEAFNASLRTCVPIVGGPSAFVKIDEYTPSNPISRSKGDFGSIALQILTLSNPYNQSYNVRWERVYSSNGTPIPLACNDSLSCNVLRGYDLGTTNGELGIHSVIAKILVNGAVVDSQTFTIKIEDFPKPTITESSVKPVPSGYNLTFTPNDGPQEFSFQIKNNATLSSAPGVNWRVNWTVTKSNVVVPGMNVGDDMFTTFGASQTNNVYLGTVASPTFDPSTLGVGSYTIRAIVKNDNPGEIVDERLWVVTVKYPDFGVVTSVTNPITSVDTIAFYNISYDVFGFRDAASTKSQYCVRVSKPEGTFTNGSANDPTNYGIVVKYYKDGTGSPIYQDTTDAAALKDQVCFASAPAGAQQMLFYSDGSPVTPHYKTLQARVFDEQTGLEMCVDGTTCSMTYPISWKVLVKPQNTPPTAVISSAVGGDNITYTSSITAATTTANATVTQDAVVRVRYKLTDDALEHDPFVTPGKFKVTALLKRGVTTVSTTACDKDFTDPYPGINTDAGTNAVNLDCVFTLPSSDVTGPIPNSAHILTLQMEDLDSPATIASTGVGTGGKLGTILTVNLTVVEKETAPTIALANLIVAGAPVVTAVEGNNLTFQFNISDAEKDNYTLTVKKCADVTCATAGLTDFAGNTVTPVTYIAPVSQYDTNSQISYAIPENAIGNNPSGTLYFKAFITDIPNTPLLGLTTTTNITVPVTFYNPPPVIAGALSPVINTNVTPYNAFSGNRFEVSTAGAVTDASTVTSEGSSSHKYQWWIKPDAGAVWTAIAGATNANLRWTPGPELSGLQNIAFCVSDESTNETGRPNITNPPGTALAVCSNTMFFTPRTNLSKLTAPVGAGVNGEVAIHHIPAERTAFVAYSNGVKIFVEKFTYDLNGAMNTSGMRVAEINAVGSVGASTVVKNLSLSASSTYLYIAYAADKISSPLSFQAYVRKINIGNSGADGSKTATNFAASTRKIDFSYSSISVDTSNCPACTYNSLTRQLTFDGTGMTAARSVSITVSPYTAVTIGVSTTTPAAAGTICGAACTGAQQALDFIAALNGNTSTDIQGLTGIISGAPETVEFKGVEDTAFYDHPNTVLGVGKIVFTGSNWYLPVINSGLGGASQNNIQVINGADGDFTAVNIGNVATSLGAVSQVDNMLTTGGNMLFGYVTLSGAQARIAETTSASGFITVASGPLSLFSGAAMSLVKVRASLGATNPNVFVVAKDATNAWRVARTPASLGAITAQNTVATFADISDASNATILGGTISDIDIQPAQPLSPAATTNEARLVVASNAGGSNKSYFFRWKQISSSPLEALDCAGSTNRNQDLIGESILNATKVVLSPAASITIGDAGNTVGDKTNSSMLFMKIQSAGDRAEFGILNSEVETINSTTRDTSGFFRPAMVR